MKALWALLLWAGCTGKTATTPSGLAHTTVAVGQAATRA